MSHSSTEYMLTTVDNPYDPFTEFDEWYAYDTRARYYTLSFLARVARSSPDLSDVDQKLAIQVAIDEIVKENVSGIYRKVAKQTQYD